MQKDIHDFLMIHSKQNVLVTDSSDIICVIDGEEKNGEKELKSSLFLKISNSIARLNVDSDGCVATLHFFLENVLSGLV